MQSGIRQEWRGKAGHVPAFKRTVRTAPKFQSAAKYIFRKITNTWLPCKCCTAQLSRFTYIGSRGGPTRGLIMGFFTEMFARPRPQEHLRYRSALALLLSMSNADRADIGIKPADFPRIAREMSIR
ncbi:hypothetical protein ACFSOZ_10800 [Mesorhizobium newzealandense]|uniref:DUF1127 domain-containing protein n=1 Tax=Mesorhizobium newzealandense TaxID=1300302 RepID=A0ABW4UBY3_9HYPH